MRALRRVLFFILLPLSVLSATRLTEGPITVTADCFLQNSVNHGLLEYTLRVTNRSDSEHTIEVGFIESNHSRTSQKKEIPAQGNMLFHMHLAPKGYSQDLFLIVDGTRQRSVHFPRVGYGNRDKVSLLVSKSFNTDDFLTHMGSVRSKKSVKADYNLLRSDSPCKEWSGNELAYSSFDGIVLNKDDFSNLSSNAKLALEQYVMKGGILSILGMKQAPFSGAKIHTSNTLHGEDITEFHMGFGTFIIYSNSDLDSQFWLKSESRYWSDSKNTFKSNTSIFAMNKKIPLVANLKVPLRGFFLLALIFTLVAGPLTLGILAKKDRRIWMLWIIPIEAAITCGVVLMLSLMVEGVTPTVRTHAITFLDQEQHTGTTLSWQGFYFPQRPSDGLLFDEKMDVEFIDSRDKITKLDLTKGRNLRRGISSRAPAYFQARSHGTHRGRLEFLVDDDGKSYVINGLGTGLTNLLFCDESGQLFNIETLAAGAKAPLSEYQSATKGMTSVRSLFKTNFKEVTLPEFEKFERYLNPGTFMARLDQPVFVKSALGERKTKSQSNSLVYGVLPKQEL